jgi:hypothetical protein
LDGLGYVTLTEAVGSDDRGNAITGENDLGMVRKGLKSSDF